MREVASPRHIVIIGAARSGTKILRDALANAIGAGRVPYDIGYVWRYGNEGAPDDVIEPEEVSERARRFIRRFVDRYAEGDPPVVIEKTVGNALRVPAVHAVLPDAVVIHLIRDGVDVIESTQRQWTAPADLSYLAGKVRHFPPRLMPTFGLAYVRSAARRQLARDRRVGTWGLRYPGIDADLAATDLLTVCARQWREGVARARTALETGTPPSAEVRYEDFVTDPSGELARLADFVGLPIDANRIDMAVEGVRTDHRGQGRSRLTDSDLECVEREVGDLLAELGYAKGGEDSGPGRREDED